MTDAEWEEDDRRVFDLAETLAAVAQPEMIRCMRSLGKGRHTSVGIGRREGLKRDEVREVLFELACSGLVAGDEAADLWNLTDRGLAVWRALDGLLSSGGESDVRSTQGGAHGAVPRGKAPRGR